MLTANFPGPDSRTFRLVQSEFQALYGIDMSYPEYHALCVRMSDQGRNFFTVRFLEGRGPSDGLWAVLVDRPDAGEGEDAGMFVPVVRNKHSKAICQVLPPEVLGDHADGLRILTPTAQRHFNACRTRLTEEGGFTFFTLQDYGQVCDAVRDGKGRLLGAGAGGSPVFEVALLRKGHKTPRLIAVEFDADLALATDAWGSVSQSPVRTESDLAA